MNNSEVILIDTGLKKTAEEKLIPLLQKNGMFLKGIFCTHYHIDHSGGNALLKERFNPKIVLPYTENVLCESSYNFYNISYDQLFGIHERPFTDYEYRADYVIETDQTIIEFEGHSFRIIQTPGHSPYHISYITPDNVAYLGDVLYGEKFMRVVKLSYVFDIAQDLKSKRTLKELNCDKYILSHGGIFDDISLIIDRNIEYSFSKIEQLLDLLKEPKTYDQFTAGIMDMFNIYSDLGKMAYVQKTARSYISYFVREKLADTFIENNQFHYRKLK